MIDAIHVRVVDEAHPMFGRTGAVSLGDFERAATRGAFGRFEAMFDVGAATVRFGQVELEHDQGQLRPGGAVLG